MRYCSSKRIIILILVQIIFLSSCVKCIVDGTSREEIEMKLTKFCRTLHVVIDTTKISWTKHTVDPDFGSTSCLFACDINNDDIYDIVGSSWDLKQIAWWYYNKEISNWSKQIIGSDVDGAAYVYPIDMDIDNDIDILSASWNDHEITWWKNNGGNPISWTKQPIRTAYENAHEVCACDADGDGDVDIFGASSGLDEITVWKNDLLEPTGWQEQKIGSCYGARSLYVTDIDNDTDNDVLGADFERGGIYWYKNDGGNPIAWTPIQIASDFKGAHHVLASDIDGDGKKDILAAGAINNKISLWKNEGGNPIRWTEQIVDSNYRGSLRISVADIDNDGNDDIIGTSVNSNKIAWWRNDGGCPINWSKMSIDMFCTGAWPLDAMDMDDDGDTDVIGGGSSGVYWYENDLYTDSKVDCSGNLIWNDVQKDTLLTGSFTVENIGTSDSLLFWEVIQYPEWGNWSCFPSRGENLRPGDGKIIINVSVIAPDEKNTDFSGEILLANMNASGDSDTVPVILSTSYTIDKATSTSFHTYQRNRQIDVVHNSIPIIQINKTIGGTALDWGWSIQQTGAGGYIIAGETVSYGAGGYDAFIVKTDACGNEMWQRTYGGSYKDGCRAIQQTDDAGYILAGYTDSFGNPGHDYWLIRTDEDGNELWSKVFGGKDSDAALSVQQTTDKGFVITGYSFSFSNGAKDAWVIKTDDIGNIQWEKNFGGTLNEYGMCIKESCEGCFIIVGAKDAPSSHDTDLWLLKLDTTGEVVWEKTYGGFGDDWGGSVISTDDNGYIICGDTSTFGCGGFDVWLLRINSDGMVEWDECYGDASHHETGYAVQKTHDGGYIITGSITSLSSGDSDILLIKTNSFGELEWNMTFAGNESDIGYCVDATEDGGYIITGFTDSYGAGSRDIWLIKLGYEHPLEKPIVQGPSFGKIGETYQYSALTLDDDSDQLYYLFDWGDGNTSGWLGPFGTNKTCETSHIWLDIGEYEIRAKAKDINGLESEWSDPLPVSMPKNRIFAFLFDRYFDTQYSIFNFVNFLGE